MRHGIQDRPDEATELSGDGGDGNVSVFALIEPSELFAEAVLGFEGDGDDLGRLTLAAPVEDEVSAGVVTIVPGGLNKEPAGVDIACFGNRATALSLTGRALHGDEAEVGHEGSGRAEAVDVIDLGDKGYGGQCFDAPQATESLDEDPVGW
jgi:hypothetical protein